MIPDDELNAIQARVDAIPAGPWKYIQDIDYWSINRVRDDGSIEPILEGKDNGEGDVGIYTFFAHAHLDIPKLLGEVCRLRTAIDMAFDELSQEGDVENAKTLLRAALDGRNLG